MFTLRVFAQKGTKMKYAQLATGEMCRDIIKMLNDKYGGSWVYVENLITTSGILFSDSMVYEGYHTDILHYSDSIVSIIPTNLQQHRNQQ